jgi:DNA-binding NtrC family response regulator
MRHPLQLLIVSSRTETPKGLFQIIEGLPINAYTRPTIEGAWEVLMSQPIDVIFCDEWLPDGHYPDFLSAVRSEYKTARFIPMLSSENDWEDYLQAMRLGASDVLRVSYQPTDVELVLFRAGREAGPEQLHLSASA